MVLTICPNCGQTDHYTTTNYTYRCSKCLADNYDLQGHRLKRLIQRHRFLEFEFSDGDWGWYSPRLQAMVAFIFDGDPFCQTAASTYLTDQEWLDIMHLTGHRMTD